VAGRGYNLLAMPRLRRIDCSGPGLRRMRRGRGFQYLEEDGTPIDEEEVLERIRALAIPPAWKEVWICPHPRGHIQATGFDDAGRKQYLYHQQWRENRDREKFDEMLDFARALPALRRRVVKDLGRRGLVEARVCACAVRLLDLGFFRIGSERYAGENGSFGLATLRKKHLTIERGAAVFDYRAKGAKRHRQVIEDPVVLPTLRALRKRRDGGPELLAYRVGRSGWADLRSDQINEYLKEAAEGDFSAKDFRTWNATVLAAVNVARLGEDATTKAARKRVVNEAVKQVAEYLSNTPAVCRSAYIDPRVFDRFDSGETIRGALDRIVEGADPDEFPDREKIESAVVRLIA
jgi:DNA topoisomerase I